MPIKKENLWKKLYDYRVNDKIKFRDLIMLECGWSQDTFYRHIKSPEKLSPADRKAISSIYDLPIEMLFPEK